MNETERVRHLMNYLAMLVHRAGGRVVIGALDEFNGRSLEVRAEADLENDRVILTVEED